MSTDAGDGEQPAVRQVLVSERTLAEAMTSLDAESFDATAEAACRLAIELENAAEVLGDE
jgi:hypothetical protein